MPFNALHHHAEDEHLLALASNEEDHSCELDLHSCQGEYTGDCGHEQHIATTIAKCFSCQFHFIKTFETVDVFYTNSLSGAFYSYFFKPTLLLSANTRCINNKGPPIF